jgi:hypothetical protein
VDYEVTSLINSHRGISFYKDSKDQSSNKGLPFLFVGLQLWGDDFEPNYSIKANQQSVHILTYTFIQRVDVKSSIYFTYPVAIGSKGSDHAASTQFIIDSIENKFQ